MDARLCFLQIFGGLPRRELFEKSGVIFHFRRDPGAIVLKDTLMRLFEILWNSVHFLVGGLHYGRG